MAAAGFAISIRPLKTGPNDVQYNWSGSTFGLFYSAVVRQAGDQVKSSGLFWIQETTNCHLKQKCFPANVDRPPHTQPSTEHSSH